MFRKFILPVLAIIGLLQGIRTAAQSNDAPAVALPVAEPARPPFANFVAGSGLIEPTTENIAIATPLNGVVSQVFVQVGSKAKKDDALFQLDDRNLRAELARNDAIVAVAKAELQDSKSQLALWKAVPDRRAVSIEEMDKRQNAVAINEARVSQAEAERNITKTNLERLVIRSPIDGEVLQVKIRAGEYAAAQVLQNPLMLLGAVEGLHVRVDIDENDAWRMREGARAHGFLRGNATINVPLQFVRFEPYVIPKKSLSGDSSERVDTRVLQALYRFEQGHLPIFVGQQMDVFIEAQDERDSSQRLLRPESGKTGK